MALTHNSKLADNEPKWKDVDTKILPKQAFVKVDEKGGHYPHHWVDNPELDDKGMIIDGDTYLHQ